MRFKDFYLCESVVDVKIGHATVSYSINEKSGEKYISIQSLRVPQKYRGQGDAKKAMEYMLELQNKLKLPIRLISSPLDRKTNPIRLNNFYKKFGFVPTGEKVNFLGDEYYQRNPDK